MSAEESLARVEGAIGDKADHDLIGIGRLRSLISGAVLFDDDDADAPVERVDRYTITVDGTRVRADAEQEARIRAMDATRRTAFARIVGRLP